MTLKTSQRLLVVLWLLAGGTSFMLLVSMTLTEVFADKTKDVWQWWLPNILPTMALVIAVVAANEIKPPKPRRVSLFFVLLTSGLSIAYLSLVLIALLATAAKDSAEAKLITLNLSNLFLGPVQGLVASALGVFFVRSDLLGQAAGAGAGSLAAGAAVVEDGDD